MKASSVGLNWEFHHKCKVWFEVSHTSSCYRCLTQLDSLLNSNSNICYKGSSSIRCKRFTISVTIEITFPSQFLIYLQKQSSWSRRFCIGNSTRHPTTLLYLEPLPLGLKAMMMILIAISLIFVAHSPYFLDPGEALSAIKMSFGSSFRCV